MTETTGLETELAGLRTENAELEEKLRLAGADRVISLYSMGGRRMVLSALQPLAADFMDTLATGRHGELLLAEFEVNEQNGLAGRTCAELLAGAHSATLLANSKMANYGKVLVVGYGDQVAELYDPATGTFTATGSMIDLRFGQTATLLQNGQVLIAGGESKSCPQAH